MRIFLNSLTHSLSTPQMPAIPNRRLRRQWPRDLLHQTTFADPMTSGVLIFYILFFSFYLFYYNL